MDWILWLLGFIGHIGLWCVVFNRTHASAWPRPSRKATEKGIFLAVLLPLVWIVSLLVTQGKFSTQAIATFSLTNLYFWCCVLLGLFFTGNWCWRRFFFNLPLEVVETKTEWIDVAADCDQPILIGSRAKALGLFPFNEVTKLTLQRMTFAMDVPNEFDGLKICQLSDLHYTGRIAIDYFHRVVEEANRFEPDLVFVTGDLVDNACCLPWLNSTLGKLESKMGVFYVFGNHDRRIKSEADFRDQLDRLGLIQSAGQWHDVSFQGGTIQITGNELPWYLDAENLPPKESESPRLRILLSHSPDQLSWGCEREFDLMFAGHTHGGQVAFPWIGPIVSPSKYGVRYASGTFRIGKMLMHVSRGTSGDEPIRWNSPPELGLFTIRSKHVMNRDGEATLGSR